MKKILVISNTTFSIKKFREHYLSKINDYNFDIWTPNNKIKTEKETNNIVAKKFESKNLIKDIFEINRIVRKEKIKNIIAYSTYYAFILTLVKIFFKFDLISVVAGRGSLFFGRNIITTKIMRQIFNFFFSFSKAVIFINPYDKKFFLENMNFKYSAYTIPTEGVEYKKFTLKKNYKKNFIFFGRLIDEKGIREYVQLSKKLKKNNPNCNFYIAGPTNQSVIGQSKFNQRTLTLISKNKKYVKYLGFIENYKKIFPKMDCLISPSYQEGAGTSVMEAMMSGLFVIGFNNTGHNYVIGDTGNLICKSNNLENLEKNFYKFLGLTEKELIVVQQKSKKRILNNFSSKNVAKKFKYILNNEFETVSKLSIVNFYQTTEQDSAYPRHLYLSNILSKQFDIDIYGCRNNHFILNKKNYYRKIKWINSINYKKSVILRFLSVVLFNLKIIFFHKSITKSDYIYITDNLSCFIFNLFRFRFKGNIIYEARDIYPDTLTEFYDLHWYITKIFKIIELSVHKKVDFIVSTLNRYDLYLRHLKIDKKFILIPNFFNKFNMAKKKKSNIFAYIGSITYASNMEDIFSSFLKINNKRNFKLLIISKGDLFHKYQSKYENNQNIEFITMKDKKTISYWAKKSKYGFISYYSKNSIYKYGISPRKINYYLDNGIIPILISKNKASKFFLDNMFILKSPKELKNKIKLLEKINMKTIEKKLNYKINKIIKLNENLDLRFSNFLNT